MTETWSNKWLRKFNPSKTKVVYFSRKASPITPTLFYQGDKLECVPVHRHLGLSLSKNLSWSEYIFSIVEKAYKAFEKIEVQNWKKIFVKIVHCIFYNVDPLLNTHQLFGMAALRMILKNLKKYSYLQLELLLWAWYSLYI